MLYGSEAFNDRKKIATEYLYDKNGNAVYDANAGVSTMQYNLLNLPEIVQFADGHQNRYSYSAGGAKLIATSYTLNSAITVPQGTINPLPVNPADYIKVTTDYIGNKVYQNGSLKQIQTSEGYCQSGVYYYYLKDHLGNTRVVINSSGTTIEKSHYYPFGMRFFPESTSNSAAIGFRYNGKEFETMNGLNRYDYGARFYDPQLGRFHSQDAFAEKFANKSPYHYASNNPILYIDINGDSTFVTKHGDQEGVYRVFDGNLKNKDDRGIYLVSDDGVVTPIGQSISSNSFFDDDGSIVESIIDFESSEGSDFLAELIDGNPNLVNYMLNARNGKDYDFKEEGIDDRPFYISRNEYRYRGSTLPNGEIGSARDFGNIGAGIVASRKGLSWGFARLGFDGYQSIKSGKITREGIATQSAQRYGFDF